MERHGHVEDGNYKWKVLATVGLACIMGGMDFSFINLSLPLLTKVFKTDLATSIWLNLIFSVVLITIGPFLGKFNDRIGQKNIFIAGTAFMTTGLVACSLGQSMGQLIAFRVLHGIGNAMLVTSFAVLITDAFPERERGRGLGLQNAALSLGFIMGPAASGIVLNWMNWRAIFYTRIPIGIAVLVMAFVFLKVDKPRLSKLKFDFLGSCTSAVGLLSLIVGITMVSRLGIYSPVIYILIPSGLVLLVLFVIIEGKVEDPLIDSKMFHHKEFSYALFSLLFYWIAVQGYAITMPFYLMEGRGLAPSQAGLLFTVGAIVGFLVNPIAGHLSDRVRSSLLSAIGTAVVIFGIALYLNFGPFTSISYIVCALIVMGIGGGIFVTTNASTIMGAVKAEHRMSASALMASVSGLALSLGMSWASTLFSVRKPLHSTYLVSQNLASTAVVSQSVCMSFHDVLIICVMIQVLALVFAFLPMYVSRRRRLITG